MKRADVNYNLLTKEVERRLGKPRYPLKSISSLELLLQYGCSKRANEEAKGFPILRMNNLQAEGWNLDNLKYVELNQKEFSSWRLEKGDIVFNRTNSKELVGKCEVFDEDGDWIFASYLMRLRVAPKVAIPEFVTAFLNTRAGRAQIDRESRQIIGMSNINAEEIRTLRIPLPDTTKQEELLAALNTARKLRKEKLREADALLISLDAFVLDQLGLGLSSTERRVAYAVRIRDAKRRLDPDFHSPLFSDLRKKMNSGVYDLQSIATLCAPLRSGFAAGADDQTDDINNGIPHIRPLNISNTAELHFNGTKMVPRSSVDASDLLKSGEVLFNNTNSTAWVGKSVVFDLDRECACSNHITRLQLNNPKDNPYFLAALLNALRGMGYFGLLATNFNNQAGINVETLSSVKLPWPDPDRQSQIARELMERRSLARKLRSDADGLWEKAKENFENQLLG